MEKMTWTVKHTHLQEVMKQQMLTLQQLLANLHQEELLLSNAHSYYWLQMMEERKRLMAALSLLQERFNLAVESLQLKPSTDEAALKDLLPLTEERSWEILAMQEQIFTLKDRMSLQVSRNHMLKELAPKAKVKMEVLEDESPTER
jgi:hypothetical protein